MNNATLSADVISFTLLPENEKRNLEKGIKSILNDLALRYKNEGFYGRIVQGDYIECAINNPKFILRIALIIKTFIKSNDYSFPDGIKPKLNNFLIHGLRLAVAVAPLHSIQPEEEYIDGPAIYLSGRTIKNLSTSDKKKVVIKNTMFFRYEDPVIQEQFETIFSLLDTVLSRCSAKQSKVIYYKLLDFSEKQISIKTGKYQSTISQHSTSGGWNSIEKAVHYFEKTF
jgi:hypothetical protein